jgi:hypothetical protein
MMQPKARHRRFMWVEMCILGNEKGEMRKEKCVAEYGHRFQTHDE